MRKLIVSVVTLIATTALAGGAVWTASLPSGAADSSVEVNEDAFVPAEITVTAGSNVIWRNTGKSPHSAKAEDGSFDTGYIVPGGEGQVTFATPGDFAYYCEPHPYKKGVVHVQ